MVSRRQARCFTQRCVPCHGDHAQGVIGPNLTDDYWIHGNGTLMDIYKTVVNGGVADKGMPTWGKQLKPDRGARGRGVRGHPALH